MSDDPNHPFDPQIRQALAGLGDAIATLNQRIGTAEKGLEVKCTVDIDALKYVHERIDEVAADIKRVEGLLIALGKAVGATPIWSDGTEGERPKTSTH
jgi:hypothetical protein